MLARMKGRNSAMVVPSTWKNEPIRRVLRGSRRLRKPLRPPMLSWTLGALDAAEYSFVNFDGLSFAAHRRGSIVHGFANTVRHEPSRSV